MQFVFGDCVLDPDRRELTRGDETIATGPLVFDLLLYLVEQRERVVSKDDLLDAVWSGRIVSESTLASHINAARRAIGDSGQEQAFIRTVARKGFRFVGAVREVRPATSAAVAMTAPPTAYDALPPGPELPDKPSIAALPFLNLSGDAEQEYFADGVVEDIISALSRMNWLFVIARNSSFIYKGQAVDVKRVGRELGVRYVLEGSVRKASNRLRINGQLIDATTGANLWAERFESTLDDMFDLQDQVAASVVGAIAPQLERAEIGRAKRKPTGSLDAYDYYLRGMAHFHLGTRAGMNDALPLFYKALDLDPEFASAYAMAAAVHHWQRFNGWADDPARTNEEGARLSRRAVELGRDDAAALARGAHSMANFCGDIDGAVAMIDRALTLNPNLAAGWFLGSFVRLMRGETDEPIERLTRAMRLSPLDSETFRMQGGVALAHLFAGRFDESARWAEKALREMPTFPFMVCVLTAAYAQSGRVQESKIAAARLHEINPELRVSSLVSRFPYFRERDMALLADGLRKAGLPD